ncbi:hypothetical protein L1049_017655 [Liquidambar formosana]|uniref:F-box protein n=1 Tax=Liquidambar formosana TaxID=63359 RepID=A0AAP0X3V9_LIQFO
MADDDETHHCLTKTTSKSSNWAGLHSDPLEPILNRLSYVNVIRFEAVCSPWHSVQQAYISSNPSNTWFPQAPWPMLPPQAEKNGDIRFFHLEEKRVFALYKDDDTLKKELGGNRCLGSTHGWLCTWTKQLASLFLTPFRKLEFNFPPLKIFPP